ncbi:MAG: RNA methyltransferase [Planctomycetes bacterium]|nr:RNA methyltransferase [Planctomycetota bacterium]
MSRFFFVDELPAADCQHWQGSVELVRHIRALRIAPGSRLILLANSGPGVTVELTENNAFSVIGRCKRPLIELDNISLASAWPKGSRGDDLIRRATELGAKRISPLRCERSVVGRNELSPSKTKRLNKIAKEACQQCRRPDLPIIDDVMLSLQDLASTYHDHLFVCLSPQAKPLMSAIAGNSQPLLLIVGPEGGFSPAEEQWLVNQGALLASIGPTILRIEAAGPSAIAIAAHCRQS